MTELDQEYFDKLEKFYTKEETIKIVKKFITDSSDFCKKNGLSNDNLKSIAINFINDLYEDNKINPIEYDNIEMYLTLSPQERCPAFWKNIIDKIEFIEDKKNNIYTTDIYECFRCHKRKCTIEIIQTRSADEPATTFVNCIVCGNHWAT
jgi:DNA-directed RNA polymerase subunit M/transcription elongation factor TFIIS